MEVSTVYTSNTSLNQWYQSIQFRSITEDRRVDRSKLAILKSKYFQKATRNMQFIDLMDVLPDALQQIF